MPRFTRMLAVGMEQRGHTIEIWHPQPFLYKLPIPAVNRKWLGYADQYFLFPQQVRARLKYIPNDTLFVFTDQALGPWVPLVTNRPHVIHCHDFLAQKSALNQYPENKVSWSGRHYQRFIRRGYTCGENFISVSQKTQKDLHCFLGKEPLLSEVVYNGLNNNFSPYNSEKSREILSRAIGLVLKNGYILHVGGNDWYKNRRGVIEIYNAWRSKYQLDLPLLLIGPKPSSCLAELHTQSPYKKNIHWLSNISDDILRFAYAGATVLLYPSLAEGFGWPIAEAMACGCPVITTNESPMNEVARSSGFYIPRRPTNNSLTVKWAVKAAEVVMEVYSLSFSKRTEVISAGLVEAKRFCLKGYLPQIEQLYYKILVVSK